MLPAQAQVLGHVQAIDVQAIAQALVATTAAAAADGQGDSAGCAYPRLLIAPRTTSQACLKLLALLLPSVAQHQGVEPGQLLQPQLQGREPLIGAVLGIITGGSAQAAAATATPAERVNWAGGVLAAALSGFSAETHAQRASKYGSNGLLLKLLVSTADAAQLMPKAAWGESSVDAIAKLAQAAVCLVDARAQHSLSRGKAPTAAGAASGTELMRAATRLAAMRLQPGVAPKATAAREQLLHAALAWANDQYPDLISPLGEEGAAVVLLLLQTLKAEGLGADLRREAWAALESLLAPRLQPLLLGQDPGRLWPQLPSSKPLVNGGSSSSSGGGQGIAAALDPQAAALASLATELLGGLAAYGRSGSSAEALDLNPLQAQLARAQLVCAFTLLPSHVLQDLAAGQGSGGSLGRDALRPPLQGVRRLLRFWAAAGGPKQGDDGVTADVAVQCADMLLGRLLAAQSAAWARAMQQAEAAVEAEQRKQEQAAAQQLCQHKQVMADQEQAAARRQRLLEAAAAGEKKMYQEAAAAQKRQHEKATAEVTAYRQRVAILEAAAAAAVPHLQEALMDSVRAKDLPKARKLLDVLPQDKRDFHDSVRAM